MFGSIESNLLFTGCYIEIHVFSFSFKEYCLYYDDTSDTDRLFDDAYYV